MNWNEHLKNTYQTTDLPLKDAMKLASKTYHKKSGGTVKKKKQPKKQPKKQSKKVHFDDVDGSGLYQDVMNGINRLIGSKAEPLQDGEYHLPDQNYSGPGTILEEKLRKGVKPLNKTDKASMDHDIAYNVAMTQFKDNPMERAKAIRRADEYVVKQYDQSGELLGKVSKIGIKTKMAFEDAFGPIAKSVEKEYYGSRTGLGMSVKPTGEAHKLIVQTLHAK